jgi:hypothetical protein
MYLYYRVYYYYCLPINMKSCSAAQNSFWSFYATLAYVRHFIFAGCYDNGPWYLVTNLAGHLDFAGHFDLAGFYFSKCPANDREISRLNIMDLAGLEHSPPPLTGSCRTIKEPSRNIHTWSLKTYLWWREPNFKYNELAWDWTRAPAISERQADALTMELSSQL